MHANISEFSSQPLPTLILGKLITNTRHLMGDDA